MKRFLLPRECFKKLKGAILKCLPVISIVIIFFIINEQLTHQTDRSFYAYNEQLQDSFAFPEIYPNSTSVTIWQGDPECSEYKVQFGMNIEPTFLVSFPRSGNTWTRYLLECATGIFSGSVYDDKDTFNLGYKGELEPYQSGRTLVIKTHTHAFKNSPPVKLDGPTYVILLIRNPAELLNPDLNILIRMTLLLKKLQRSIQNLYCTWNSATGYVDALTSYWSFKTARDNKEKDFYHYNIDSKTYKGLNFRRFFREYMEKWGQINESILLWTKNLLVVFYEDLKENPIQELRRMLDFLEVKEDEKRISCLKKHMKGPAKRDHNELKIEAFTKSEKRLIAHSLANTLNLLRNRGIKPPKSYSNLILPENMAINLNNSFV